MIRQRWLFGALVVALVGAIAAAYLHLPFGRRVAPIATELPRGAVTQLFAARFADLGGRPQALEQWRGKTLVVNFWASWCAPCREEMPAFSRLQTRYADAGVQFVGIAIDTPHNVAGFARQLAPSYPLLLGEADGPKLMRALGNAGLALPYTVVVDAGGTVRMARLGRLTERELDAVLGALVAAPGTSK